jgi:PAS domain S-box-containing protein
LTNPVTSTFHASVERLEISRWFAGVVGLRDNTSAREPGDSDSRVRRAVDLLPMTLFEFDSNGIYTCVAGGYVELFGVRPAQVIGSSVFDFPKFVPGKNMMVRRALAGESVSFNGVWPRGRFTIQLEPRRNAEGRVVSVVGLGCELAKPAPGDRELEKLLEALRQSELRFRAMCESAPLGIFVSNSQQQLTYVNPALCTLLARPIDTLIGRPWQTLVYTDEPSSRSTPRGIDAIVRLARHDGSPVWTSLQMAQMRDDAESVGYIGVVVDVTHEREARLAIERAQQDLRRVIEWNPEGIAVIRDEQWIFVNRALADMLRYGTAKALVGQPCREIVHPDDRVEHEWTDGEPRELRCRRADGEYALLEIRAAELSEFEGAPALLLAARDITERKRLEAQSLLTERLLSMGTLAAGVAHEINNPLAAVVSQLEWLAMRLARIEELPADPPLAAALSELVRPLAQAQQAAARMRTIVRDLKVFSRVEEEREGRVDLSDVLDSAVRMAWNELRHRARFVRDYGDLPLVQGSEARLGQVFLNLLINAAHAIPEGRADQHEIALSAQLNDASQVIVEVRDSGCGIAPHLLAQIFDPFFTTKPPGVGSGLGLSICQRIVNGMGGKLEVESKLERGSVFRVTLDCAREEPCSRPLRTLSVLPNTGVRGRVLVIDDDPAMASAIELVLGEDHEVAVFTSARRALARLHAGERYDAIVCDVMMPEMSGMDFHSELARSRPELAAEVIFLTGGAFTANAREFLNRIENERLDKPFDSHSLRQLVSEKVARASAETDPLDPLSLKAH